MCLQIVSMGSYFWFLLIDVCGERGKEISSCWHDDMLLITRDDRKWDLLRSTTSLFDHCWSLCPEGTTWIRSCRNLMLGLMEQPVAALCLFTHTVILFTLWYELSPLTEVSPPVWLYNCAYNDSEGCSKGSVIRNHSTFVITAPVCVTAETLGQIWYLEGDTKNRD